MEIKHSLQKGITLDTKDFLYRIDKCVSKLIPYVNAENNNTEQNTIPERMFQSERVSKSVIVGSSSEVSFDSDKFLLYRKSA